MSDKPSPSTALIPYRQKVPAVGEALGDLDAYIRAANAAPMLTAEQEAEYARNLRDRGDIASAQKLVVSHLRFVISTARGYLGYGLPLADLIQEGNIGLMKAVRRFDPDRGVRLATFAMQWIHAEIREYVLRNWRLVRIATTKAQRKLFFNLRSMHQGEQSIQNDEARSIATTLDVKPEEVLEMEQRMKGRDIGLEGSPDDGDGEDRAPAPIDWMSREEDSPQEILEAEETERRNTEGLSQALASLDPRSRRIIQARYLHGGEGKGATLADLAAELGISNERVRQIEKAAIKKMREFLQR